MNFAMGLTVCIAAVVIRLIYAPKGKEFDRMFGMLIAAGFFDMLTLNGCQTFLLVFLAFLQTALSAAFVWLYWANASGRINVFFTTFLKAIACKLYGREALSAAKAHRQQPARKQQVSDRQQVSDLQPAARAPHAVCNDGCYGRYAA